MPWRPVLWKATPFWPTTPAPAQCPTVSSVIGVLCKRSSQTLRYFHIKKWINISNSEEKVSQENFHNIRVTEQIAKYVQSWSRLWLHNTGTGCWQSKTEPISSAELPRHPVYQSSRKSNPVLGIVTEELASLSWLVASAPDSWWLASSDATPGPAPKNGWLS